MKTSHFHKKKNSFSIQCSALINKLSYFIVYDPYKKKTERYFSGLI